MRRIEQEYLRVRHPDLHRGQDMVLQTVGLKLLGGVRYFNPDKKGEKALQAYLETQKNIYHWAKADGYRVYVHLCGGLRSIRPQEMEELRDEIYRTMKEMANFYASVMTEGMRRHFTDKDE